MKEKLTWFDKVMTAVTFAEANDHQKAKEFIAEATKASEAKLADSDSDAILTDLHGAEVR